MPKLVLDKIKPVNAETSDIGKRIAFYRKKRGLTQKELAEKIGVDRMVITNYELNRARVYDEILARIAMTLKVSSDILLGIKDSLSAKNENPSLRIMKRMRRIEELTPAKQKIILRNIDLNIAGFNKD